MGKGTKIEWADNTCPFCGFPAECDCRKAGKGGCELNGEGDDVMCACCAIDDDAPDCCGNGDNTCQA